jgi:hypothetical protein
VLFSQRQQIVQSLLYNSFYLLLLLLAGVDATQDPVGGKPYTLTNHLRIVPLAEPASMPSMRPPARALVDL